MGRKTLLFLCIFAIILGMSKEIRLNKYLADCGVSSRRSADRLIESEFSHEDFKPDNKHWNEMRKIAKRKTAAGRLFKAFITWKDNIDSTVRLDIKYDRVIIAMNELYDEDFSKSSANLDVKSFGDKYSK